MKSTETRWILSLKEMDIVEQWFEKFDQKFKDEDSFPRQDYYLKTDSKNLGVKIREPKIDTNGDILAKLELKTLTNNYGAQKFNNQNTGLVNSWVKYSFDLDSKSNPLDLIYFDKILSKDWLLIEKDRLLIKYDIDQEKIVSAKEIINNGAGIELTKFKLNNKLFFTLGIEFFSEENKKNIEGFTNTMKFLFNDLKILGLAFNNSKTYPEILMEL